MLSPKVSVQFSHTSIAPSELTPIANHIVASRVVPHTIRCLAPFADSGRPGRARSAHPSTVPALARNDSLWNRHREIMMMAMMLL